MAEYIEREALSKWLHETMSAQTTTVGMACVRDFWNKVLDAPAADVAPVVHGRFVLRAVSDVTSTFMCSECGREFEIANAYFGTPTNFPNKNYPYCNCGARMGGE